jgi:hypothetical protein
MSETKTRNRKAPDGYVWACLACGKTSEWSYGFDDKGSSAGAKTLPGWDESCGANAALVKLDDVTERSKGGRILKLRDGAVAVSWLDADALYAKLALERAS